MSQCNRILVVDQATQSVGACVVDVSSGKPKWIMANVIKIKGKSLIERIANLYEILFNLIDEFEIDTLVLEEVSLGRKTNIQTTAALLKCIGVCEVLGFQKGLRVEVMNVNHWKSVAGITAKNREGQKAESIQLALKRWPMYADLILKDSKDDLGDALNMSIAILIDMKILKNK
ncbi:MAG: crossover junction endodeoxyribonuclease RuvC [Cetobacterium sp.]|uniref:crossover junction endodeoxyribonuclease RuvC n=1 Tax=Cetobacterium sp. TaxID=2071632 RepID=UPI003F313B12